MAKAAVLTALDTPLEIRTDVEVEPPRAGEVKVRMGASGVCHSDLSMQNGTIMSAMPVVLGHEGAGVIEEVGEGVTNLKPGDHVVVSWVPQCGDCFFCVRDQGELCEKANAAIATGGLLDGTTRFTSGGSPLFQMAASGTFSEVSIIPAIGAVKIPDDIPLTVAALVGCGVLTGVGAAINTADIRRGDTVAVIGCGGVGLNVIQGARIAGADRIIAIDQVETKLALAKQFGATDSVNAGQVDAVGQVMGMTSQRGADVAFEVIGLGPTIDQAVNMTRRGGQTILVGVPRMEVSLTVPVFFGLVLAEKTIKGCWYGSSNVHRDVGKLLDLYRAGDLKLDELISRTITLDEVNDAFDAMKTGEVARSVIDYGLETAGAGGASGRARA
ncbi:MAG: Zn-dependent alcohol dehydrogenase [Actinobacteria bacterium]|nr:MAG: Zn-dependent alcohol dehydrogenase [Actinomycetota bacterium]